MSPGQVLQSTDPNTEVALKKYMNSLRSSEDKRIKQRSESLHNIKNLATKIPIRSHSNFIGQRVSNVGEPHHQINVVTKPLKTRGAS